VVEGSDPNLLPLSHGQTPHMSRFGVAPVTGTGAAARRLLALHMRVPRFPNSLIQGAPDVDTKQTYHMVQTPAHGARSENHDRREQIKRKQVPVKDRFPTLAVRL
jgi:hypothetical protein